MKYRNATLIVACFAVLFALAVAGPRMLATATADVTNEQGLAISVTLAPKVFILNDTGGLVTAHTSIPCRLVVASSVELEGLPALSVFADSCGRMVAKFDDAAVKKLIEPPEATLVLTGVTTEGEPFSGSDTIVVKQQGR